MSSTAIICLGNEILTDDSFGYHVARALQANAFFKDIEVIFAPLAGFNLLDLINQKEKVLIIDAAVTGDDEPGTVRFMPFGEFTPSYHLTTSHQIDLPTALEFGRRMGMAMPLRIDVLTVEAADVETLSEEMTPSVKAAIGPALERVKEWIAE